MFTAQLCKNCQFYGADPNGYCSQCQSQVDAVVVSQAENSGGDSNYYLIDVTHPKRLTPYTAECEDIIRTLGMNFDEGEAFKALWRRAAQRTFNKTKLGNTPLRDAEKIAHYGTQILRIERTKQSSH